MQRYNIRGLIFDAAKIEQKAFIYGQKAFIFGRKVFIFGRFPKNVQFSF